VCFALDSVSFFCSKFNTSAYLLFRLTQDNSVCFVSNLRIMKFKYIQFEHIVLYSLVTYLSYRSNIPKN